MSGNGENPQENEEALEQELAEARKTIQQLETELTETNEGMIALTLELEETKERYRKIFEASNDAILLIDTERDEIYEANPRACELFGYSHDELLSLSPSEIFPDEGDRFRSFVDAMVQGWADGFTCRTKNGRQLRIETSVSVFTLDGRSLLLAAMRDVTQRERQQQRLQVLNRIFRHNLRNDGNVIQGHADTLDQALSDPELQASTTAIKQTVDSMLGMSRKVRRIQDVLDQNYVDPVALQEVLEDQREKLQQTYPNAEITVDSSPGNVTVGQRLGFALQEAMNNAIKHHDNPDPSVEVTAERLEDEEKIVISVADRGPGVPAQDRETIVDGKESPLTHGSGVGIWFIHWVISSLGGELRIEDNDPRGTVLTMIAPIEDEEPDLYTP